MWLDTGELVKLLEKLDEAQAAISAGTVDVAAMEQWISETRQMIYRDLASADNPQEMQAGKR